MANVQDFFHDKTYNLKRLLIASSVGASRSIDVTNQIIELSIFEDMFASTTNGEVTLSDSLDLIPSIPIIGFEMILLVFGKPNTDHEYIRAFRVYKIDDVTIKYSTTTNQMYNIRFCSDEQIVSMYKLVSKSYKGKKINEIVTDLLKNQLKTDKIGNIEETSGKMDIVIPFVHPLEAIQMATRRSLPTSVFFENNKGFNLVSLKTLYQQPTKASFFHAPQNIGIEDGTRNAIKYEFLGVFDLIAAIKYGMFGSVLRTIDLVRMAKTETKTWDYEQEFAKLPHIEQNAAKFTNNSTDRFNKTIGQQTGGFYAFAATTKDHDNNANIKNKQPNINPNMIEEWMLQRASVLETLQYLRLKLVIPGDVTLSVGDVIEFSVPLVSSKIPAETNLNPYISGRYMITALRHKIDLMKYEMIIEATKDCLQQAYPQSS